MVPPNQGQLADAVTASKHEIVVFLGPVCCMPCTRRSASAFAAAAAAASGAWRSVIRDQLLPLMKRPRCCTSSVGIAKSCALRLGRAARLCFSWGGRLPSALAEAAGTDCS
eukprot:1158947-Pelagomonas_calceolata.AAC.12